MQNDRHIVNIALIGFMGVYMILGMLWLFLIYREIERGPEAQETES